MKSPLVLAAALYFGAASVAEAVLVTEFLFDGTDATVATDTSGNGFHGTIGGGATRVPGVLTGSTAMGFDGDDDVVSLAPSDFAAGTGPFGSTNQEISISAWVQFGITNPEQSTWWYGTNAGGGRQSQVHLPWENGSALWRSPNGQIGVGIAAEVTASQTSGQWHHFVFTKGAAGNQIWINNVLRSSGGDTGTFDIVNATLGNNIVSANPLGWDGAVDLFRVYDHVLDPSEIDTLFAEAFPFELTDFNEDGFVNTADYDIMAANFLTEATNSTDGDANLDGFVDLEDFVLWRADFEDPSIPSSAPASASAAPEPSTLILLAAGLLPTMRRAPRRLT